MPLGEPIILEPQFAQPILFKYTDFYMKKMVTSLPGELFKVILQCT